jgi:8-oxo-dGTP pyrophosphatase MutT (NUDIX family)
LLIRNAASGLEVFMVKRHHQIDFASGALVFPGGKVDALDRDPALRAHADGGDALDDLHLSLAACTIREGFEESGILLARHAGSRDLISAEHATSLKDWRPKLNAGEVGLGEFLVKENLRLACDVLIPFAHWVTPTFMPKRFDTYFYLAATPVGQLGRQLAQKRLMPHDHQIAGDGPQLERGAPAHDQINAEDRYRGAGPMPPGNPPSADERR